MDPITENNQPAAATPAAEAKTNAPASDSYADILDSAYEATEAHNPTKPAASAPTEEAKPDASASEAKTDTPDVADGGKTEDAKEAPAQDKPLSERIKIDPAVKAQFPAEAKRLEDHIKGLELKETELASKLGEVQNLAAWEQALANPATAGDALQKLVAGVAEAHKLDLSALFGTGTKTEAAKTETAATPAAPDWQSLGFASKDEYDAAEDYRKAGFDSPGELQLAKRLEETQTQLTQALDALRGQLTPIQEAHKAQVEREAADTAKRQEAAYVQQVAPTAIAKLAAEHSGWAVTQEMVAQAIAKFPALRADPAGAVEAAFARQLASHYSESATKGAPKMPDLVETGQSRTGRKALDPTAPYDDLVEEAYRLAGG